MRYTRFEHIVLLAGGTIIFMSMVISVLSGSVDYAEIIAQALLFLVMFAAVRRGRRGGSVAAIIASVAYILMVLPTLPSQTNAPAQLAVLVLRLVSFGLVGIVGGELCTRFRYGLTRFGEGSALDDWSLVFRQEYIHAALTHARARHSRYGDPLSVILIAVSPVVFTDMKPVHQRALVRSVAGYIRAEVRTMDEVARLEDGRFAVLLPHTPAEGGAIACDRLRQGVVAALGSGAETVNARVLALPEDDTALGDLIDSIAPSSEADERYEASGEYSSSANMTRKPAATSASSAPDASTLNTSTAASPEGSTKQ